MRARKNLSYLILMIAFTLSGCSSSDTTTENDDTDSSTATTGGTLQVNFVSAADGTAAAARVRPGAGNVAAIGNYGEAPYDSDGITSFKMYFREIKICEQWSPVQVGCASIYSNLDDPYAISYDENEFNRELATAAGEGKYFDVLSATDRAALTQSVSIPAGEYNYGNVEAHHYVKLTARVPRASGDLCTQTGGTETAEVDANGWTDVDVTFDSLACPAEGPGEAVIWLASSNTTFKFLKPFTVEDGDEVELDLAFNLDGEVKGGPGEYELSDGTDGISVPMIRMVPVPRLAADKTMVERYIMTPSTTSEYQFRVELYYSSGDEEKSILAALVTVLGTDTQDQDLTSKAANPQSVTQEGTTVSFLDTDGNPLFVFDRATDAAGEGVYYCPTHSPGNYMFESGCNAETVALTYDAAEVLELGN